MGKIDYHIHGTFSSDSRIDTEELIKLAIERGYESIAFTEHFDFKPVEIAEYGVPAYLKYHRHMTGLREKYGDRIDITIGVEAGEYNRYGHIADAVFKYAPPELVIGSIHSTKDDTNFSLRLKWAINRENLIEYYSENLDMVKRCNIDILGHLGIHKRYLKELPDESFCEDIIDEIFRTLIQRGIMLEINYSPLRRNLQSILPEPRLLKRFCELGGERITIGSDSHRLEDFDLYYDQAISMLESLGFNYIFYLKQSDSFSKRKWIGKSIRDIS